MAFLKKSIKINKYNISKEDMRVNWLKCYDKNKDEDVSQKELIVLRRRGQEICLFMLNSFSYFL